MSYKLNFHQTFPPEREAISQLLQHSKKKYGFLNKEEISQMTTIPTGEKSGKVVPNIIYAEIMGLLNVEIEGKGYKLFPSPLGELVCNEDQYMLEPITMWACHYNLVSINSKALLWSYIYNDVVQQLGNVFDKEVLSNIVNKKFGADVNLTPFRSCYFNDRSLATLNIFKETGETYSFSPHKIEPSFKFLYAFQLLSCWEKIMENRTEITINDVKDKLFFGSPYLWGEREILNVLELLQDERIIILNRQLNPLTIIKQASSRSLLSKIYSLLI